MGVYQQENGESEYVDPPTIFRNAELSSLIFPSESSYWALIGTATKVRTSRFLDDLVSNHACYRSLKTSAFRAWERKQELDNTHPNGDLPSGEKLLAAYGGV